MGAAGRRGGRRAALWIAAGALAVVGCGVLLAVASGWRNRSQPIGRDGLAWRPVAGEYAGSAACHECHAAESDRQQHTHHAETVRRLAAAPPLAPFNTGQGVVDPLTGARYEMTAAGGEYAVTVERAGAQARQPLQYEFGAGRLAHGYVADLGGDHYLDCRLNYYQATKRWWFASGQEKPLPTITEQPLGRPLAPGDAALCFSCHATDIRAWGVRAPATPGAAVRLDLARSELGVGCEACHGPRAEHVLRKRGGDASPPPARTSADRINQVCGQCHSLPEVTPNHPSITRFQPWGLAHSRCFQASDGRLSCLTCHDPHADLAPDPASYDSRCRDCHASAAAGPVHGRVCPINPASGCVSCHMPRDSKSMLYVTFTDHRIRVVKP